MANGAGVERTIQQRRRVRWTFYGAGPGAILVVATLLLAPTGLAAHPSFTTIKPPYRGTIVAVYESLSYLGCGKAKFGTLPAFYQKTGKGVMSMVARAPSCTNPIGDYGSLGSMFDAYVPIKVPAGAHTVEANWTLNISSSQSLRLGACTPTSTSYFACYQDSVLQVTGAGYIIDATVNNNYPSASTWRGIENQTYNYTIFSSGTYSNSSGGGAGSLPKSTSISWWFNVTFVAGHKYYVLSYFSAGAVAELDTKFASIVGGNAYASLNMATFGGGAYLTSMTVY